MPSCAETADSTGELARLYAEWDALAEDLCGLAGRQRDLLLSGDGEALQAVLDRKDSLYLRTQSLSERADLLNDRPTPDNSAGRTGPSEADAARDRLFARLMRLSDLEAESRQVLRGRMEELGREMEGMNRRRSLANAYGNPGGPNAGSPRFLDQKR
jgi:hypothetical protein